MHSNAKVQIFNSLIHKKCLVKNFVFKKLNRLILFCKGDTNYITLSVSTTKFFIIIKGRGIMPKDFNKI